MTKKNYHNISYIITTLMYCTYLTKTDDLMQYLPMLANRRSNICVYKTVHVPGKQYNLNIASCIHSSRSLSTPCVNNPNPVLYPPPPSLISVGMYSGSINKGDSNQLIRLCSLYSLLLGNPNLIGPYTCGENDIRG